PHIAGYSQDGKRRGTEMIWQGFCETFGLPLVAPAATEGDLALVLDAGEKRATVAGVAALGQREDRAQAVDTAALEQRENRTMVTDAPEKRPAISADVALLGSAENRPTTADALDACLLAAYDIRADDARLRALARDPE